MATDGVKIIDGDLAHDTYTIFIDKFEQGVDIETIKKEALLEKELLDDFDYEVLMTSYALALWEIGHLDTETLEEVKALIKKGACAKRWSEWERPLGKAREKVLERFFQKISTPKKNPRKVKKFKGIQNLIFNEDDVLVFKKDDKFCATIVAKTEKARNYCIYKFATLDLLLSEEPKIEEVLKSNIFVSKVGCWETEESILSRQPGLKDIFETLEHEYNTKFYVGLVYNSTEHRHLKKFAANFTKIGSLKIIEGYKYTSSGGYEESFEQFTSSYKNKIANFNIFRHHKIKLSKIVHSKN